MEDLFLIQPANDHEAQYEAMMDEWEDYGGRINPGALSRFSHSQQRKVIYKEWLKWIEDDKKAGQDLYFFINGKIILGAISIRPKKNAKSIGRDGHVGFGIRPSERNKGYATKLLSITLSIMKKYGINPVVITCDKDNFGSAKTIMNNGGYLVEETADDRTGNIMQIYHINL